MKNIMKEELISRNSASDLENLKVTLDNIKRSDLKAVVDEYNDDNPPSPNHQPPPVIDNPLHLGTEEREGDISKSKVAYLENR